MTGTTVNISFQVVHALYLFFCKTEGMSSIDSYVRSLNYALLAIAKMPNNELTSIHALSLPPLHL